jgi:hypothetical protein
MNTHGTTPSVDRVRGEIEELIAFYGLDRAAVGRVIDDLAPHLERYAEIALTARGFEILTGGKGARARAALADVARRHGAIDPVVDAFVACDAAFPGRMLGLKVCFGPGASAPTLYHRMMASKEEAFAFLATLPSAAPAIPALRAALARNRKVYGLAFIPAAGEVGLKLYTIGDVRSDLGGEASAGPASEPGFVSYRIARGRAQVEIKRYLTDVGWDQVRVDGDRWPRVVAFARGSLGYEKAAYLGVLEVEGRIPEMKLYVERIGAIPTDYEAR